MEYRVVHFHGKAEGTPHMFLNGRKMVDEERNAKIFKTFRATSRWVYGLNRRCWNCFTQRRPQGSETWETIN